jgi:hypothetical protein
VRDPRADHDPGCRDQTQHRAKEEIDLTKKDVPESRKDRHHYLDDLAHTYSYQSRRSHEDQDRNEQHGAAGAREGRSEAYDRPDL